MIDCFIQYLNKLFQVIMPKGNITNIIKHLQFLVVTKYKIELFIKSLTAFGIVNPLNNYR